MDKKIRILHLTEDMRRGGQENIIALLARGMDRDKYSSQVWCLSAGGEVAEELLRDGLGVRVLGLGGYYNPLNILRLALLLRRERFDILHAHGYFASTFGRLAGVLAGVPCMITHVHSIFHGLNRRNIAIDRLLNRFTRKIIFIARSAQDSFEREGYRFRDKAAVLYNGVPAAIPQGAGPSGEKCVIVNVASLYAHKGQVFLLRAMKEALPRFPQAELWIVGDGPLRSTLEEESRKLGIGEKIVFLGKRTDVRALLSQARIFVLPSTREGVPLSILEAMAAGLPVVASKVGGIPEVVDEGKTGFLCPPGDPAALTAALVTLLEDPVRSRQMGRAGQQVFERKFDVRLMLERLDGLYQECLDRRR
jgi:glycosyltransferase involved in cell wall biosynthesis